MQQIKYKRFAGIRKIGFCYNIKIKQWSVKTPNTGKTSKTYYSKNTNISLVLVELYFNLIKQILCIR